MVIIPFAPSIPEQAFTVQLGLGQYSFRALWNARARDDKGLWYLDVSELDGTPILKSVAIVLGTFLGRRSPHPLFRAGVFVAVNMTRGEDEAGLDDLGVQVQVRYFTLEEAFARLSLGGFMQ